MTPERWARIKEVFHAALERDEAECAAFLDEACGADADLRQQVERLLREHRDPTRLKSPVAQRDLSGRTLSHYRILEKIGEGGMGVVYRAQDTRLHRTVALKFLCPEALGSEELKTRFLHEAEAAAALDHPNICTVYEIDEAEGQAFLAMAYVDGESLSEKIRKRPLPLEEALGIAIQVAEGLHAAHKKGIVHRDIKSGNVMIDSEGRAKIMDFGLAHLTGGTRITQSGTVLGTPAYMSPEQVRGEEADHRTDIWSLGVVLYEMVTGRLPFRGDSAQSVALAIQNEEPEPLTALRSGVPLELERIVNKALAKDTGERYPHIDDLLVDLRSLKRRMELGPGWRAAYPRRRSRVGWYVAGGIVVAALMIAVWFGLPTTRGPEVVLMPVPLTAYPGSERSPSFSPDGNQLAFTWDGEDESNFDIYVKRVGPDPPLRLTSHPARDDWPAWSPDGDHIAFLRDIGAGKAGIFLIPALGGPERQLAEKDVGIYWHLGRLAWSPDGQWLLFWDRAADKQPFSLFLLSVDTLDKCRMTFPPEPYAFGDHGASFSPDGRGVVFVRSSAAFTGDVYSLALSRQFAPEGEPKRLTSEIMMAHDPIWTPDGREIIFASGGSEYGGDMRLWRLAASRSAGMKPLAPLGEGATHPAISSQGHRLAYSHLVRKSDIWRIDIAGPEGQASPSRRFIFSTRVDHQARWSPDGTRIAFLSERSGNPEIWVCDSDGSNARRVTFFGGPHVGWPTWSPDGKLLAFDSMAPGQREIYSVSANVGAPRRITNHPADDTVPSWSHDGRWIYFLSNRTGESQVWKMPANGGKAVQVTKQGGMIPFESPNGEFVYYTRQLGTTSLWKVPVDGGEETQVLKSADFLSWLVTDRGIYFISGDRYSIEFLGFITGETELIARVQKPIRHLSVSPDGKSILYTQFETTGSDLMLVENFR